MYPIPPCVPSGKLVLKYKLLTGFKINASNAVKCGKNVKFINDLEVPVEIHVPMRRAEGHLYSNPFVWDFTMTTGTDGGVAINKQSQCFTGVRMY